LPSLDYMRVFECLSFVSSLERDKTKFDDRGRKYIYFFLGDKFVIKDMWSYISLVRKFTF